MTLLPLAGAVAAGVRRGPFCLAATSMLEAALRCLPIGSRHTAAATVPWTGNRRLAAGGPMLLALAVLGGCAPPAPGAPQAGAPDMVRVPGSVVDSGVRLQVQTGVDRLRDSLPAVLLGRRVGLITNHTGRDANGRSTIDVLASDSRLTLVALYGPEHGIRGTAAEGATVESGHDAATGLPIFSLYGATQKPTPQMLAGVQALVFDIQDVGARPYTYIYTMALAMQAAREQGIPFVVLDRPNPIGGSIVEGNRLDPAFASFVGMYPIAVRHGLTVGELARLFNREFAIGADLTVVPMEGWRRAMWFDETGLPFVAPSPNIPRLASAVSYPGTVFLEGTNLSEGRGTDHPFEQTGAPWLRADSVVRLMNGMALPGVHFESAEFTPAASAAKYGGVLLHGVRLVVTDRDAYRPVSTALRLIDTIRRVHPAEFRFTGNSAANPDLYWMDRLAGTDRLRKAMERGALEALLADWAAQAAGFDAARRPYELYE